MEASTAQEPLAGEDGATVAPPASAPKKPAVKTVYLIFEAADVENSLGEGTLPGGEWTPLGKVATNSGHVRALQKLFEGEDAAKPSPDVTYAVVPESNWHALRLKPPRPQPAHVFQEV